MARPYRIYLATILLIAVTLVAYITWRDDAWIDEMGHLGAGGHAWTTGSFELYRVNPPLVRLLAAVPLVATRVPLYADTATPILMLEDAEGFVDRRVRRQEWIYGNTLRNRLGSDYAFYLTAGRLMLLPFFVATALICWYWGRMLGGAAAGWLAIGGFLVLPESLNWAARITPDSAFCFTWLLIWFCGWNVATTPSVWGTLWLGLALGMGLLVKTTAIVIPPLMLLAWTVFATIRGEATVLRFAKDLGRIAAATATALVLLNLAYGWQEFAWPLKRFEFVSTTLSGGPVGTIGNRFVGTWFGELPSPLPATFLSGIDLQKAHFEAEGTSCFHGRSADHGWWWYYLAAMAIKTPVAMLVLWAVGVFFIVSSGLMRRWDRSTAATVAFLLVPAAALFILVSSQTGHTRNLRYVLPCVPLVLLSLHPLLRHGAGRKLVWGLLVIAGLETALAYPHLFNYSNAIAGGPTQTHHWFRASSYDNGIEDRVVRRWIQNHPNLQPIRIASRQQLASVAAPLPPDREHRSGRYVVVNRVDREKLSWPLCDAVATIGCTRLVYRIPEMDEGKD